MKALLLDAFPVSRTLDAVATQITSTPLQHRGGGDNQRAVLKSAPRATAKHASLSLSRKASRGKCSGCSSYRALILLLLLSPGFPPHLPSLPPSYLIHVVAVTTPCCAVSGASRTHRRDFRLPPLLQTGMPA
ncbi:hypothetical protein MTO96_027181 [Rhipicephalus appendiculatus]